MSIYRIDMSSNEDREYEEGAAGTKTDRKKDSTKEYDESMAHWKSVDSCNSSMVWYFHWLKYTIQR